MVDPDQELSDAEESDPEAAALEILKEETSTEKIRKRKRKDEDDDKLEDNYLHKLQQEEEREQARQAIKKSKEAKENDAESPAVEHSDHKGDEMEVDKPAGDQGYESNSSDEDDDSDSEENKTSGSPKKILHETQLASKEETEKDKAARTIFLGNLPSSVISSKVDYRTLRSVFKACGPIASIRFRSIAFSERIPRKAAFITHKFHEKQKTVNAYLVFKSKDAVKAALKLNGAVVLDHHVRVDSVAHPAPHDAKRCVFVGNLDFEAQEEPLWRYFSSCGKIEYVRIVRDAATNFGKGFAYVQFEDINSVEKALLLNDKKPAPKERKLRVVRAKNIKRKAANSQDRGPPPKKAKKTAVFNPKADPATASTLGRAKNLLGKAGAAQLKSQVRALEGIRASATTPSGVKNAPKLRPLKAKKSKDDIKGKERAEKWKKTVKERKEKEAQEAKAKKEKEAKEKKREVMRVKAKEREKRPGKGASLKEKAGKDKSKKGFTV